MSDPHKGPSPDKSNAGRGGLALAGGKIFFMFSGLLQQILLKQVLGLSGYGAYSTAASFGSVCYNPLVQAGIQGVSRETAANPQPEQRFRTLLSFHTVASFFLALVFCAVAGPIARYLGAPHITTALRILSVVLFSYGVYASLIGYLNGQRRFGAQAGLDVFAATVRTAGLLGGAWLAAYWWSGSGSTIGPAERVLGAMSGFGIASLMVLAVAAHFTGRGKGGDTLFSRVHYAKMIAPIWAGQLLLNGLFQADGLLLRRFAAEAARIGGLPLVAADPYVGAYRAGQLFCFLPFQLLTSITFVLFPLLAAAHASGRKQDVEMLVVRGLRLSVLLAGLVVSVLVAIPGGLLTLVFQQEASGLAHDAMRVLSVGMGFFAVLGVITSLLNSLGAEKSSFVLILLALLGVLLLCLGFAQVSELSAALLTRVAAATSVALILTTVAAGWNLHRIAGATAPISTTLRVILAGGLAAWTVSAFLPSGHLYTLLGAVVTMLLYVLLLTIFQELGREDVRQLRTLLRR